MLSIILVLAVLIVYPYLIYPLILLGISLSRKNISPVTAENAIQSVTIVLSVYNEEQVIVSKIENLINLDYPAPLLNMIIVSDGSSDRTDDLIKASASERVQLITQGREGKTAALNKAAAPSTADILVFTDANTFFSRSTIRELVAPFTESSIGLVTGRVLPQGEETGEGLFGRFEMFLKEHEGRLGVVAGADGALYALRRSLYTTLPAGVINDFYHPIAACQAGYRSSVAMNAIAYEESSDDLDREIPRQRRMVNQAFSIARDMLPKLLLKGKFLLAWVIISHKLLRWLQFPFLLAFLLCAVRLSITGASPLPLFAIIAYCCLFLAGRLLHKSTARMPALLNLGYKFQLIHFAYFLGILDNLRGYSAVVWNPRGGAQ